MHAVLPSCQSKIHTPATRLSRQRECSTRATRRLLAIRAAAKFSTDLGDGPSTSDPSENNASSSWNRRHVTLGAVTALTALAGCNPALAAKTVTLRDGTQIQAFEHGMSLAIVALRGSVPVQWAADFKTSIGRYCGFSLDQRAQLADIFRELSDTSGNNKRSAGLADVVTLGDTWLAPAVQRGLIQPITGAESYRWYRLLPRRLRELVRRNALGMPDPSGAVYGAPYRWGCTLIAYRRDRLLRRGGRPILDWSDLLQPALTGRLAMLDSPRELLAVALRSLAGAGAGGGDGGGGGSRRVRVSPNASAAELEAAGVTEEVLKERVEAFRRQVRLFSSRDHVRALQAGDVWAVVGHSQDLVQLAERSGNIELVAPLAGTLLWADVWAVPAGAKGGHRRAAPSPLLPVWLEFTLSPGRITGQPGLRGGAPAALLTPTATFASDPDPEPRLSHDPAAASVLSAIHDHRRHLIASRAAPSALPGPLAATLGSLSSLPLLRPFLHTPHNPEQDPYDMYDAADSARAGTASGASSSSQSSSSLSVSYPAVELHGENGYLPAGRILERSEFLLPLDGPTLEMYRRVLEAAGAAAEPTAASGP